MISSKDDLFKAIEYMHIEAYRICQLTFGEWFENAGNIGIFCQSNDEYDLLIPIRNELTIPSDNLNLKYYTLKQPIHFVATEKTPKISYRYLYIRKPDISNYGKNIGDVDFFDDEQFMNISNKVKNNKINNAILSDQVGVGTMIQVHVPNTDVVIYLSTKTMTESIRVRH